MHDKYGLVPKLLATARTVYKQATCKHGPWLKDVYSCLPGNVPSAHCKQCYKRAPQALVSCRAETESEYVERAVRGGLSHGQAVRTYWDFPRAHG